MTRRHEGSVPAGIAVPSLMRWGLSADADLVYRTLATFGATDDRAVSRDLGLSRVRTARAMEELRAVGLASAHRSASTTPSVRTWRAVPPRQAVEELRQRRLSRSESTSPVHAYAQALHAAAIPQDVAQRASDLIYPLHGRAATLNRIADLANAVRHESLAFEPAAALPDATLAAAASLDLAMLDRGVRLSTVCLPPTDGDGSSAHEVLMRQRGSQARYARSVPIKLMVFDRKRALIPIDPAARDKGALEIADPTIVAALVAMFHREWDSGRDPQVGGVPPIVLNPREDQLIPLLSAGHTDDSAARRLGISPRTVTNVLRALMDRLGVDNRFQLGLALGARSARVPALSTMSGAQDVRTAS